MHDYYFNNAVDEHGRHEVHTAECAYLPKPVNRTYIGFCSSCSEALTRARITYPYKQFDGCFWCSRECHRG